MKKTTQAVMSFDKQPMGYNHHGSDYAGLLQRYVSSNTGFRHVEAVDQHQDLEEILDILTDRTEATFSPSVPVSFGNKHSTKDTYALNTWESEKISRVMNWNCSQLQTHSIVSEPSSGPSPLVNDYHIQVKDYDIPTTKPKLSWNWGCTAFGAQAPRNFPNFASSFLNERILEKSRYDPPNKRSGSTFFSSASESCTSLKDPWAGPPLFDRQPDFDLRGAPLITWGSLICTQNVDEEINRPESGLSAREKTTSDQQVQNKLSGTTTTADQLLPDEEQKKRELWKKLQKKTLSEPKYTFKIRSQKGTIDDGYRWRKYGQKIIKNSPYTRSYYRCTHLRCQAKKHSERSTRDPTNFRITYMGIHLHQRPNPMLGSLQDQMVEEEEPQNSDHRANSTSKLFTGLPPQRKAWNSLDHLWLQTRARTSEQTGELIHISSGVGPGADEGLTRIFSSQPASTSLM